MVSLEGAEHAVGQPDMIVQPAGEKIQQLDDGIAIAAPHAPIEQPHLAARRMVLAPVPHIERVSSCAHLPLLVRKVVRHVDHQVVHDRLHIVGGRAIHHGSLQIVTQAKELLVFVVHRWDVYGVRFVPFKYSHVNIFIIAGPRRAGAVRGGAAAAYCRTAPLGAATGTEAEALTSVCGFQTVTVN